MSDELKQTVRIMRRAKVTTDDRGRTVWAGPVEPTELELVSTTMLERVLSSSDENRKQKIKDAAAGKEGLLAHDRETDNFEIIDDSGLLALLQQEGGDTSKPADVVYELLDDPAEPGEELSLVSTQVLRRMLKIDDTPVEIDGETDDRGFNPYDNA
jgi:hypothetical protein